MSEEEPKLAPPPAAEIPTCVTCGAKLAAFKPGSITPETMDGLAPTRGYEGNNRVCTQRCGFELARGIMLAEPNIVSLLPPGWNAAAIARQEKLEASRRTQVDSALAHAVAEPPPAPPEDPRERYLRMMRTAGDPSPAPPPGRAWGAGERQEALAGMTPEQLAANHRRPTSAFTPARVPLPRGAPNWVGRLDLAQRQFYAEHGPFDSIEALQLAQMRRGWVAADVGGDS